MSTTDIKRWIVEGVVIGLQLLGLLLVLVIAAVVFVPLVVLLILVGTTIGIIVSQ
jgi:hypothetical protein